jgi:tetratricopeptide (TPR) repeat protein
MLRSFCISIVLILFCLQHANTQSCECKPYNANKNSIEDYLTLGDSLPFNKLVSDLVVSSNSYCVFISNYLKLRFKVKNRNFKMWDEEFLQLKKSEKTHNCAHGSHLLLYLQSEYYQESDQVEAAMQTAFELLKSAEKSNDHKVSLEAISILVSVYARQNQETESLPYLYKAIKLIEKSNDDTTKALYYNWLARNYESSYAINGNKEKLDSATLFVNKAFVIAKKNKINRQLQYCFQIKEAIAYHEGSFDQSLSYHDSAYYYIKLNKAYQNIPLYFQMKAYTLLELGRKDEAIIHQDSAIYYARKYSQPSYLANYLKAAAEIYEQFGLSTKAIASLKEHIVIKDSVQTAKRTEIVNELEQKYQKEKNEKTILSLKNQRYMLWAGLALLLLVSTVIFLAYRQKIMKRDQLILETEQRLNRARMNPHFFFNALASLQSFALNESDAMAVAENLSKFSHIMRETLENTYREYNSVQQEVDFLTEYLELQQMRFPDKFDFEINNNISEADFTLIPSMIVQPFVENSIEHGFADLSHKGFLSISFDQKDQHTYISINDNGRGLTSQSQKSKPYVSRASQIIKDRIYLLNLKLKSDAQFKIESDKTIGQGVNVNITLPVIHEN